MKKISLKPGLFAASLLLAVAFVAPFSANAQQARAQEMRPEQPQTQQTAPSERPQVMERENAETRAQNREEGQARGQEQREAAMERLEDAKLRACQNREKAIQNIMSRIADRSTKQLAVFTTIAERTQAFYDEQGNTVANYDALVAEVAAKKAAAEAVIATIQGADTTFDCEGDDPRGVAASFQSSLEARNTALNEYKIAIKDLIVGVKSAQIAANEDAKSTDEEAEEEQL